VRTLLGLAIALCATSPALAQDRVLLHSDSGDVELLVSAPPSTRPSPVILFVHGHQAPERPGPDDVDESRVTGPRFDPDAT